MVYLEKLLAYTNGLLDVTGFQDYAPNGLQVEGRAKISRLVSGVTACMALIDRAVAMEADAIVVHHGYFWRGEDPCIKGMKRARLLKLLENDISLLAYHLPLDAHPEYGNNAQLAQVLDIAVAGRFGPGLPQGIGMYGHLSSPMAGEDLARHIARRLRRTPLYIPGKVAAINSVAWCSGAAQGYIDEAVALGMDAYITGEISEQTVHIAREMGIHFFAAGHHATERFGAPALAQHLSDHFKLEHQFIDIDNPV